MCGRYTVRRNDVPAQVLREWNLQLPFEEFADHPRFNVAPSQRMPIVRLSADGTPEISLAKWGLIPSWSKEKPKVQPINARCETVATSGMFRQAFQHGRCLVPADGFYEWKGAKPPKQPYFIRMKDDGAFAFAGLWERWKPPNGEPVDTYTIITTEPNELMATIHNRMPVILRDGDYKKWLGRDAPTDLLRPFDASAMEAFPVSSKVNSPRNDAPELVERVASE
jgi:putative SOS response-associated peptidase YedK